MRGVCVCFGVVLLGCACVGSGERKVWIAGSVDEMRNNTDLGMCYDLGGRRVCLAWYAAISVCFFVCFLRAFLRGLL